MSLMEGDEGSEGLDTGHARSVKVPSSAILRNPFACFFIVIRQPLRSQEGLNHWLRPTLLLFALVINLVVLITHCVGVHVRQFMNNQACQKALGQELNHPLIEL